MKKESYGFWLKGLYIGDRSNKATVKEVIEMLNKATITLDIIENRQLKSPVPSNRA